LLAGKLELPGEIFEDSPGVQSSYLDNPDSVKKQIFEIYTEMDTQFKENNQLSLASLSLLGGWLETMYIGVKIYKDKSVLEMGDRILQQISQQVRKTPFSFLQKAESQNLLTFIQDEHPQTIALIVSHMSYHKAAEILTGLPGPKQIEVVKRVANMEQTNPEVIAEVERGLEARLSNLLSQSFEKHRLKAERQTEDAADQQDHPRPMIEYDAKLRQWGGLRLTAGISCVRRPVRYFWRFGIAHPRHNTACEKAT